VYNAPIVISAASLTIRAFASVAGYQDSPIVIGTYQIQAAASPAATPAFSPGAGTYTSAQSVTISDSTAGATIHYTTDGSTPTTSSPVYSSAIAVGSSITLNAIAVASGYSQSAVASAAYVIQTVGSGGINFAVDSPVLPGCSSTASPR
jgi:hypothetical protein